VAGPTLILVVLCGTMGVVSAKLTMKPYSHPAAQTLDYRPTTLRADYIRACLPRHSGRECERPLAPQQEAAEKLTTAQRSATARPAGR